MLWIKAFHIIFVVAWYAGLLYLPRLFVYHSLSEDTASRDRFVVMERKLFAITTVGAGGALVFGLWLMLGFEPWRTALASSTWLHLKLALVLVLVAYHAYCAKLMLDFRLGHDRHGDRFYRIINELPALVLIAVVVLVVVKPF